jgi:hypothetical protein
VDVAAVEAVIQADLLSEMRKVLERCIHPGQDVLLPAMSDTEPVDSFFIVACAGDSGSSVITSRISRALQNFDRTSKLKPAISSTMLQVVLGESGEEPFDEIAARIEQLIQAHLLDKESLK